MSIIDALIANDTSYKNGMVFRKARFKILSDEYVKTFEDAYQQRMDRMAADKRQFLSVILPKIKEEARLLAYERELASRHSEAFSEARG